MCYDYPIEQLARSARSRFQMGFARMTMHLLPEFKDIVLEPGAKGLKILGAPHETVDADPEMRQDAQGAETAAVPAGRS